MAPFSRAIPQRTFLRQGKLSLTGIKTLRMRSLDGNLDPKDTVLAIRRRWSPFVGIHCVADPESPTDARLP
ncbi:hypothetical protein XACW160_170009 [Xanthomonas citri pv. citri]|uniref:Uncharacterized protein n=1 Tax=Xanthomonas citri pv. citri TaxID=611301 RepID=A0A0U5FCJ4_XANCI|nr:hypothetical protein XAC1083_150121 [Xanthomonas citri pv. citri]CEE26779.1 hypothetical protein XAC902_160160 [Xanthomonas citri pv. citri]CEE33343.1 hypothetical protein XAC908_240127 [Xanthomonas citri pv. citri]CEE56727.1 hypothetical protein XACW160_170009 [Xanthomonas citri pv. citri]CEE59405.1 hypothetical protein XACS584_200086 [Xanthomonas citri pv. citri]